ncbi:MAG: hypothetical protein Q4A66_04065 [Eubacteriales bacterium]|nr:hypothetical protein [Eubacteriales bacterium]
MSFWDKFKYNFIRFMQGRYGGADKLNRVLLYGAIAIMLLNMFFGIPLVNLLVWVMYGYAIFRMFSRNMSARYRENEKFEQLWNKLRTECKQFTVRMKNSKQYKYFTCPKCKSRLKLPRGVGEVTVTCGKCGEKIKKKA